MLGLFHIAIFAVWVAVADLIYSTTLGPEPPASAGAFLDALTLTSAGWTMIVIGVVVGAAFAALVLATSVVSFPLLLDRDVGMPVAIATSFGLPATNPVMIGLWGLIVALFAGHRLAAGAAGADRGDAGAWPCHVAPLPAGGGVAGVHIWTVCTTLCYQGVGIFR